MGRTFGYRYAVRPGGGVVMQIRATNDEVCACRVCLGGRREAWAGEGGFDIGGNTSGIDTRRAPRKITSNSIAYRQDTLKREGAQSTND